MSEACSTCSSVDGVIQHHTDYRPESETTIPLCGSCHMLEHHRLRTEGISIPGYSSKGADITVRCLKRERERLKRAARSCEETFNKFVLTAALDRAHNVELFKGKEAQNGNAS